MVASMKRTLANFLVLLLAVGLLVANRAVLQDLQDIRTEHLPAAKPAAPADTPPVQIIRIGVISRFAPNIIFSGYQPVLDYLNANSNYRFELRLSTSYQDAVDKLQRREVVASFLGSWIFSHLSDPQGLVPLVAPRNAQGESAFHAVLVTRAGSQLGHLSDLAGARVALPSADSWSGNWLQLEGLPSVGLVAADLDSIHHFDHHQTVVWQVLRGHFDAGVVKESVANRYRREGLRRVALAPSIPGSPLVARRDAPREVIETLTRLLLELNADSPDHQALLTNWTPEFAYGFLPVTRADYEEAFGAMEAQQ
jgi:phosphonate transport system substrate-binding protein